MEVQTIAEDTQKEGPANVQVEKVPEIVSEPSPTLKLPPTLAPLPQTQEIAKKPRRDERNRKDDRSLEYYTKSVSSASTAEEKLSIASQKYSQLLDDNKKMQFYMKQSDKRHVMIVKEKEQLQLEFNKTILLRSKLENLCRELQKQNKSIKEESLHKIREEEERRKETQAKFQSTLAEISILLQQNNEKNVKLRDDNISMTEKFKSVVQQYQLREEQVEKMSKQMELEAQLNAAKAQKASLEHQAEREQLLVELNHLKAVLQEYRARVNDLQGTETGLRGQLAVYTDKYDEFQSALTKSNEVFGGFKDQMEKMSKKIKKLEKESLSWKQRWESSQSALIDMCGERQASDARLLAIQRQLAHMQSLCRTLQAERTVLLSTLKENNIERPPLPAPAPPEPPAAPLAPPAASDTKMSMAVKCAKLTQSLAQLQGKLNVLTTQQTEPAQDKPKKSKNKKNKSKKLKDSDEKETECLPETTENGSCSNDRTDNTETESPADLGVQKVDEKVLESLMQAINIANVNLCDLEVVGDNNVSIEDVLDGNSEARVTEITDEEILKDIAKKTEKSEFIEDTKVDSPKVSIENTELNKNEVQESPKKVAIESSVEVPKDENTEKKSSPKKNESPESPKKVQSPKKAETVKKEVTELNVQEKVTEVVEKENVVISDKAEIETSQA